MAINQPSAAALSGQTAPIPKPEGALDRATTVVLVFDSSIEVLEQWQYILVNYIAQMLTRLSGVTANPHVNFRIGIVTYGTADDLPTPLICERFFGDVPTMTGLFRTDPRPIGLGQTNPMRPVAALEGLVAALEMVENFYKFAPPKDPKSPHLSYIIHVASNMPDDAEKPRWNRIPSMDDITWETLPDAMRKRNVHYTNICVKGDIPLLETLYTSCAGTDPMKPWFPVQASHVVRLEGYPPPKTQKRPAEAVTGGQPDSKRARVAPAAGPGPISNTTAPSTTGPTQTPLALSSTTGKPPHNPPTSGTNGPQQQQPTATPPALGAQGPLPPGILGRINPANMMQFVTKYKALEAELQNLQRRIIAAREAKDAAEFEKVKKEITEKGQILVKMRGFIQQIQQQQQQQQQQRQNDETGQRGQAPGQASAPEAGPSNQASKGPAPPANNKAPPGSASNPVILSSPPQPPRSTGPPSAASHPPPPTTNNGNNAFTTPPLPNAFPFPNTNANTKPSSPVKRPTSTPQQQQPLQPNMDLNAQAQMQKMIEQRAKAAGSIPSGAGGPGGPSPMGMPGSGISPHARLPSAGAAGGPGGPNGGGQQNLDPSNPPPNMNGPPRAGPTTAWRGQLSFRGEDTSGILKELPSLVNAQIAASASPHHSHTWPQKMILSPTAPNSAVEQPDLKAWMERSKPILCTFQAAPEGGEQGRANFNTLWEMLTGRKMYGTVAWQLLNGRQGVGMVIFAMPQMQNQLYGAVFPESGAPDMPRRGAGHIPPTGYLERSPAARFDTLSQSDLLKVFALPPDQRRNGLSALYQRAMSQGNHQMATMLQQMVMQGRFGIPGFPGGSLPQQQQQQQGGGGPMPGQPNQPPQMTPQQMLMMFGANNPGTSPIPGLPQGSPQNQQQTPANMMQQQQQQQQLTAMMPRPMGSSPIPPNAIQGGQPQNGNVNFDMLHSFMQRNEGNM